VLNQPLQALASLRADEADLLFTDLGTPDLTGWELASRAKMIRPGLPVTIVTRYAHQLDQQRLRAMGVTRVLARPYLREEITQVVAADFRPLPAAA
jgi:CheY-like chemotaxis protein